MSNETTKLEDRPDYPQIMQIKMRLAKLPKELVDEIWFECIASYLLPELARLLKPIEPQIILEGWSVDKPYWGSHTIGFFEQIKMIREQMKNVSNDETSLLLASISEKIRIAFNEIPDLDERIKTSHSDNINSHKFIRNLDSTSICYIHLLISISNSVKSDDSIVDNIGQEHIERLFSLMGQLVNTIHRSIPLWHITILEYTILDVANALKLTISKDTDPYALLNQMIDEVIA